MNPKLEVNKESHTSDLTGVAQSVGRCPTKEKSPVGFLVRAHAWVAVPCQIRGMCKKKLIDVSVSH